MQILQDSTLDVLRQLSEDNLLHTAQIQNKTSVRGPGGITTYTWATALTVPCRLASITAEERLIGDQKIGRATWYVILPAGTPVTELQRILVSGSTEVGGVTVAWTETLSVVGVPFPRANEAMRKVLCEDT